MAFLLRDTGQLLFGDGLLLHPHMTEGELEALSLFPDEGTGLILAKPHPVSGGSVAPVLFLENGRLTSVELYAAAIGQRQDAHTNRQRAFLFQTLGFRDPCPDTRGNVRIVCPFGEVLFGTDPYTGGSCVRVIFREKPAGD